MHICHRRATADRSRAALQRQPRRRVPAKHAAHAQRYPLLVRRAPEHARRRDYQGACPVPALSSSAETRSPDTRRLQVANTVGTAAGLTFELPFDVGARGTAQVLTGGQTDSNTPATPDLVAPKTSVVATGRTFNYTAPGFSVTVLTVLIV